MDKTYSALDVAAYCINCCIDLNRPVSNLQLQKILYYVQANFLCKNHRCCFNENIIHWQYGPVVEEVYSKYKKNVASPIRTKVNEYFYLKLIDGKFEVVKKKIAEIDGMDLELINRICDKFSKYTGSDLITMTHQEEPWLKTNYNEVITPESIIEYFEKHKDRL